MIDQLRAIAIFREVVEAGSFRAAARNLGLSASVVSHHVAQLERQLGTALLYRSTRRLSLTEDGRTILTAGQQIAEAAISGIAAVQHTSDDPGGKLRVAIAGGLFERPPFSNHLSDFARTHRRVALSLSFSDQKTELIGSEFDVAIRAGWLEDSRYKARKLCDVPRIIVASPAYLVSRDVPGTLADLETHDWIKLRQISVSRQLTSPKGTVPTLSPRVAIEVDGIVPLYQMTLAGLGLAAIPAQLAEADLARGDLVAIVPEDWTIMPLPLHAVWPGNVLPGSLTHLFVSFLANRLRAAGPPS